MKSNNNKKKKENKEEKDTLWKLKQAGVNSMEEAIEKAKNDPEFRRALQICGIKLY